MADEVIHIADGESHCRIVHPTSGVIQAPLRQVSLSTALIDTAAAFEPEAALDLTVLLKGLQPRQFFATVISKRSEGLLIQWMPIDSGEQARLKSLLEAYRTLHKPGPPPPPAPVKPQHERMSGRRVIKPRSSDSIMPFGEPAAPAPATSAAPSTASAAVAPSAAPSSAPAPSPPAAAAATATSTPAEPTPVVAAAPPAPAPAASAGANDRRGTRRLVRPSQQNLPRVKEISLFTDDGRAKPADAGPQARAGAGTAHAPIRDDSGVQVSLAESSPSGGSTTVNATPSGGSATIGSTPSGGSATIDSTPSGGSAVLPPAGEGGQAAEPGAETKASIIGSDGRMDIGASIRSRARSVKASDLALRHDRVRVLNMGTIKQLIQEAVEEASHHLTRSLSEADRKVLLQEAEEGFKERLKAFEAEKLSAEARLKRLADQLTLAQQTLTDERKRTIKADQFTVSATGLDEIESKFKRLLEYSIAEGRVVSTLEDELRKVIATVFDQERQRIREQEMKAQNEKIQLLESKIKRLSTSLEDTERQRDEMQEWARNVESSGGGSLRNVFSAGMKDGDPNKKRKLALMKEILDENRLIRKELGIETPEVDPATLEAIKKVEAESALTAEEQAAILQQRKQIEPPPSRRDAERAAEMANVIAEASAEGRSKPAGEDGDEEAWEEGKRTVKAAAGSVKVTADGTETLEEGAEINPDDMPWEPDGPIAGDGDDDAEFKGGSRTIKRIASAVDYKLPPLERK